MAEQPRWGFSAEEIAKNLDSDGHHAAAAKVRAEGDRPKGQSRPTNVGRETAVSNGGGYEFEEEEEDLPGVAPLAPLPPIPTMGEFLFGGLIEREAKYQAAVEARRKEEEERRRRDNVPRVIDGHWK